eukprot:316437-Prymnesium_polylepis.1
MRWITALFGADRACIEGERLPLTADRRSCALADAVDELTPRSSSASRLLGRATSSSSRVLPVGRDVRPCPRVDREGGRNSSTSKRSSDRCPANAATATALASARRSAPTPLRCAPAAQGTLARQTSAPPRGWSFATGGARAAVGEVPRSHTESDPRRFPICKQHTSRHRSRLHFRIAWADSYAATQWYPEPRTCNPELHAFARAREISDTNGLDWPKQADLVSRALHPWPLYAPAVGATPCIQRQPALA